MRIDIHSHTTPAKYIEAMRRDPKKMSHAQSPGLGISKMRLSHGVLARPPLKETGENNHAD